MRRVGIEPRRLQFVRTRDGEEPYLFLVEGVKGKKLRFSVLKTVVR